MIVFLWLTGRFNDIYHDYKYTYYGCGIILILSSIILFVAMGINYRLLDKEAKEEAKRARLEGEPKDNGSKEKGRTDEDGKTAEDAV